jgi:hypothetical protein
VVFHSAWHETMAVSIGAGLHASTWAHLAAPGGGAHVRAHRWRVRGTSIWPRRWRRGIAAR